jgi:GNAT superfamily N-acetyltransferase
MTIREATLADIKEMFSVRMSVKENILYTTDLVTDEICAEYITKRGKGWVHETDNTIVGFAIADLKDNSIWALFVRPEYERQGIGKQLHDTMMDWYFSKTSTTCSLTTTPNTRAEKFYEKAGWQKIGLNENGEMRFGMDKGMWTQS